MMLYDHPLDLHQTAETVDESFASAHTAQIGSGCDSDVLIWQDILHQDMVICN